MRRQQGTHPNHVQEFAGQKFDLVITVCDDAAENCPARSGQGKWLHIGFPDPVQAEGDNAARLAIFRQTRDAIEHRLLKALEES